MTAETPVDSAIAKLRFMNNHKSDIYAAVTRVGNNPTCVSRIGLLVMIRVKRQNSANRACRLLLPRRYKTTITWVVSSLVGSTTRGGSSVRDSDFAIRDARRQKRARPSPEEDTVKFARAAVTAGR